MLNASFEPLCVVPMRRAVVLVLKEKAEIVARNGSELHSERMTLPVPSVIRLHHFVRVPYRNRVPALPAGRLRARRPPLPVLQPGGGEHRPRRPPVVGRPARVDNVVASCRSCNARKEDRLLADSGLNLRRPPREPHANLWVVATAGTLDPSGSRTYRRPSV